MKSAVFNAPNESYNVANVIYAGPVREIPQEHRRHDSTHSFKIITTQGGSHCYYKCFDTAKNARGALVAMVTTLKPGVFRHGNEIIDPARVVSFKNVLTLKNAQNDHTHAVVVTLDTVDQKNSTVWLMYKSEENAQKGKRALYAATTQSSFANASASENSEEAPHEQIGKEVVAASDSDLPF